MASIPKKQLVLQMTALEGLLKYGNATDFEKHNIPRERIADFEADTWKSISREHLQTLLLLADGLGLDPPLKFVDLVPNPIWETFEKQPAVWFIGRDLAKRAVAADFQTMSRIGGAGITMHVDSVIPLDEALATHNVLIVGSPKCNAECEAALAKFWRDTDKPPVKFLWPGWPDDREPTKYTGKSEKPGIEYQDHKGRIAKTFDHGDGLPVGVLVIRRTTTPDKRQVTTLIVAGSTKAGTEQIVTDLLNGAVLVHPQDLADGRVAVLVLRRQGKGIGWYNVEAEKLLAKKQEVRRRDKNENKKKK